MKRASSELVQETLMMPEKGLSPELKAQETAEKGLGALKISFGRDDELRGIMAPPSANKD